MSSYTVLCREFSPDSNLKIARVLSKIKGVSLYDIRKKTADFAGIVEENLDEEEARALALELRNRGVDAFALATDEMVKKPPQVCAVKGTISEDKLVLSDKNRKQWKISPECITILACGRVREIELVEGMDVETRLVGSPRHGPTVRLVPVGKHQRRDVWKNLLDVFTDSPSLHFRIEARAFQYETVPWQRQASSFENFTLLIRWLVDECPNAHIDSSIQFILDGNPLTNLKSPSLSGYERYLLWMLQKRGQAAF